MLVEHTTNEYFRWLDKNHQSGDQAQKLPSKDSSARPSSRTLKPTTEGQQESSNNECEHSCSETPQTHVQRSDPPLTPASLAASSNASQPLTRIYYPSNPPQDDQDVQIHTRPSNDDQEPTSSDPASSLSIDAENNPDGNRVREESSDQMEEERPASETPDLPIISEANDDEFNHEPNTEVPDSDQELDPFASDILETNEDLASTRINLKRHIAEIDASQIRIIKYQKRLEDTKKKLEYAQEQAADLKEGSQGLRKAYNGAGVARQVLRERIAEDAAVQLQELVEEQQRVLRSIQVDGAGASRRITQSRKERLLAVFEPDVLEIEMKRDEKLAQLVDDDEDELEEQLLRHNDGELAMPVSPAV